MAEPQDIGTLEGGRVTFQVTATGTEPLSYQWRRGGVNLNGATSASYTTGSLTAADDRSLFDVVVSNPAGTATSRSARLSVNQPGPGPAPEVTIDGQPMDFTIQEGQRAFFQVFAYGGGPLSYQWRRDGLLIPGATNESYIPDPATSADNGARFDVVVRNIFGSSALSRTAVLTVTAPPPLPAPPSIVTEPADVAGQVGGTATFQVTVAGPGPFTYQWIRNGLDIPGATEATYTLSPLAATDHNSSFMVWVRNAYGAVFSRPAHLTVAPAP